MIVDLATYHMKASIQRRVCVIGSGIGGGSFVTRYTEKRHDAVVVEAGGESESTLVQYASIGRDFNLDTTRMIALGGTSNIWRGLCGLMDPIDFKHRSWIPYSGWPIGFEDLKPYYIKAARMLGLPAFSYFAPLEVHRRIAQLANDIPFERKCLIHKFFIHKRPPKNFGEVIRKRFPERRTGAHRPWGFFAAAGPQISNEFKLPSIHLLDLAPTILNILGVTPAAHYRGRAVSEIVIENLRG